MQQTFQNKLQTEFEIYESMLNGEKDMNVFRLRKNAFDSFISKGFPTIKDEEWKYTKVSFLNNLNFEIAKSPEFDFISDFQINKMLITNMEANVLVFLNGYFSSMHSKIISSNEEFKIKKLRSAFKKNDIDVDNTFSKTLDNKYNSFVALNTAFAQDGFLIEVPDNVNLSYPIHIINLSDSSNENIFSNLRYIIKVGNSSSAEIIESHNTLGYNNTFSNNVWEIEVGNNSKLNHTNLFNDKNNLYSFNHINAILGRDSIINQTNFCLSGKFIRNDVRVVLNDTNSTANLFGLFIGEQDNLVDNHTLIDHAKPHCQSNEVYKGIVDDKAKGIFNGKILVRQDAQKTDAYQSSKSVVLSDNANIYAKPELEIYADDVKCSHGSSTGKIDDMQLFYLRSRGISESKSKAMLLYAYSNEIVQKIENIALRDYVSSLLSEKFNF